MPFNNNKQDVRTNLEFACQNQDLAFDIVFSLSSCQSITKHKNSKKKAYSSKRNIVFLEAFERIKDHQDFFIKLI